MSSWDEVAAYYQGFAPDPRYAAFAHDMVIAVNMLRAHPALAQLPREVIAGMIVFSQPDVTRQAALGWFKPNVYSAFTRDADGKLYDAQIVTLNGVVSAMQALTERAISAAESLT